MLNESFYLCTQYMLNNSNLLEFRTPVFLKKAPKCSVKSPPVLIFNFMEILRQSQGPVKEKMVSVKTQA